MPGTRKLGAYIANSRSDTDTQLAKAHTQPITLLKEANGLD